MRSFCVCEALRVHTCVVDHCVQPEADRMRRGRHGLASLRNSQHNNTHRDFYYILCSNFSIINALNFFSYTFAVLAFSCRS